MKPGARVHGGAGKGRTRWETNEERGRERTRKSAAKKTREPLKPADGRAWCSLGKVVPKEAPGATPTSWDLANEEASRPGGGALVSRKGEAMVSDSTSQQPARACALRDR